MNHPADVIWAVQMSTVEFHPWNSRRDDTESPDEWRIDLDPMPLATYADVRRVSVIAQEVLAELGAVGCRRHPAARDCISTSEFRRLMVSPMYDAQPGPLLGRSSGAATAWSTSRGGARTAIPARSSSTTTRTLVITRSRALHSVRGTPAGIVSAPVRWDEIANAEPADFTIATMPARFADLGDLHADIDEDVYQLDELLEWAERDERDSQERPADADS